MEQFYASMAVGWCVNFEIDVHYICIPCPEAVSLMVTIRIPTLWRSCSDWAAAAQVTPGSLLQVLHELVTVYPLLRPHLFDDSGQVHSHLNFFINQEHVRFHGGLTATVNIGDEIYIVPMITGGTR